MPKLVNPLTDAELASISAEKKALWAKFQKGVASIFPPTEASEERAAQRAAATASGGTSIVPSVPIGTLVGAAVGVFMAGLIALAIVAILFYRHNASQALAKEGTLLGNDSAYPRAVSGDRSMSTMQKGILVAIAALTVAATIGVTLGLYYGARNVAIQPAGDSASGALSVGRAASFGSVVQSLSVEKINAIRGTVNNFDGSFNGGWNPRPAPGLNQNVAWDPTLASFAASWVNKCPGGHSGGPYGENLYFSSGVQDDATAVRGAFDAWFAEWKVSSSSFFFFLFSPT